MADFTSGFWGWMIAVVTVASIVALFIFVRIYSTVKLLPPEDGVDKTGHCWDETLEEMNNPLPRWWVNLFYVTLFWGAGYLLLYPGLGAFPGLLGWTQKGRYEQEVAQADAKYQPLFERYSNKDLHEVAVDAQALSIGKSLFSTYCTTCHGSDARGARGFPNLRDGEWLYGGEPELIEATILNGRQGLMPAWGEILDEQKISQVTEYVGQLAGHDIAAGVSAGKEVYDTYCAACHGAEGQGNPVMGAPTLANDIWLYGGSQKRIEESITSGRSGNMPPHKEFLGPAKVHILAAYVYSLSKDD